MWRRTSFTKEEVSNLGIGQLDPHELEEALNAFNGFVGLFGKVWVETIFQGVQAPRLVRAVVGVWKNWSTISGLPNVDGLRDRWREGFDRAGAHTEIRMFARLVQAGADVELFPASGSRIPDIRFRVKATDP